MIEHIQILFFILLVFGYFWLAIYIKQTYQVYHYKYLLELFKILLAFLVYISLRFARLYLEKNILSDFNIVFITIIDISSYFLSLWVIYLYISISLSFRDRSFSKIQKKWIFLIAILIFAFFIYGTCYLNKNIIFSRFEDAFIFIVRFNSYLKIALLVGFCFFWDDHIKKETKKLSISFSLLLAFPYVIFSIVLFTNHLYFLPFSYKNVFYTTLPYSIFLVVMYIWIKYLFLPYAQSLSKLIGQSSNFDYIFKKYNISQREKIIIELIIDGKSNNEIKESLFISYHTVKNHLSNIYRKLNISNRHELIHLFIKNQEKN